MATDVYFDVGPSKTYATLTTAEAAADDNSNLVSRDERYIFRCYAESKTYTANCSLINYTTDATRYIWIQGQDPVGYSSGGYRMTADSSTAFPLNIRQNYSRISDIYCKTTKANSVNALRIVDPAGGQAYYCTVERCIFEATASTTSTTANWLLRTSGGGNGSVIRNCLFVGGYHGCGVARPDITVHNCACVDQDAWGFNIGTAATNVELRNCVGYNAGTTSILFPYTSISGEVYSNLAADTATTGITIDVDLSATDPYSGVTDYEIDDTNVLAGEGTNLYSTFTDDLAGNTRQTSPTAWDIGPYLATATSITLVVNGVEQTQSIDAPTITQAHLLTPNETVSAQTIGAPGITQQHSLSGDDVDQTNTIGATTISAQWSLSLNDASQSQAIDALTLTQQHALTGDDASQAQTLDAALLTAENPAPIPVLSNVAATLITAIATTPNVDVNW